jgi:hypothetical protein
MRKTFSALLAAAVLLGVGGGVAEAKTKPTATKHISYTARVLAGTSHYKPCIEMRKTKAGRIAYKDMVIDNWDDNAKRSVKAQVKYVKQGCRNGA